MTTPIPDYPRRIDRRDIHPTRRNLSNSAIFNILSTIAKSTKGAEPPTRGVCNAGESLFLGYRDGVVALYSYEQPICIYYTEQDIVLLDYQTYSNTTSRHQSKCWAAIEGSFWETRVVAGGFLKDAAPVRFARSTVNDLMAHLVAQYDHAWGKCSRARSDVVRAGWAVHGWRQAKSMHVLSRLVDGAVPVPELRSPEKFFSRKKYTDLLSRYLVDGVAPPWQLTNT